MATTSIEEAAAWQECFDGSESGEVGSCADLTARACCYIDVSSTNDCLTSTLFESYSACYVGAGCLPLTCDGITVVSTVEGNGTGRLSSPLGVGGGGVASVATFVMTLIFAVVAIVQV